jgi:hypothetical protein
MSISSSETHGGRSADISGTASKKKEQSLVDILDPSRVIDNNYMSLDDMTGLLTFLKDWRSPDAPERECRP